MELRLRLLHARLEWCQRLRTLTGSREEKEGWLAEEEGLRDALLGRERTGLIRVCYPSQVERYRLGFHDGHALLFLSPSGTLRRHMPMEELGQTLLKPMAWPDGGPPQAPPPATRRRVHDLLPL